MTTYLTDRHGQRWALVPVEPFMSMLVDGSNAYKACRISLAGYPLAERRAYEAAIAASPAFEPREPTDAELDAVMPAAAHARFSATELHSVRQAMRAAMALWSKT